MRRLLRFLLLVVAAVAGLAAGALGYFVYTYPRVSPAPSSPVAATPDILARGQYLANHVALCTDCHSERDWTRFAGPAKAGALGKGGERFDRDTAGLPGVLYASNITPAAIGSWSDGEILRAFTEGVSRDGRALFPLMPYPLYAQMAREDAEAIVAYVRTLPPIENQVPGGAIDFPVNLIVRTVPAPARFSSRPSPSDTRAYGEYVARSAGCIECHTPRDDRGDLIPDRTFAGGNEFKHPSLGYRVRAANITPDADTGIGTWTEQQFVDKFKAFERADLPVLSDAEQRQNTAMPWTGYAGMTREDLAAIYTYLRSVKPVVHRVDKWPDSR